MQTKDRAATAQELADWFRATATDGEGSSALMARIADLLEQEADDEPQDVVPEIAPADFVTCPAALPRACNDNRRAMRQRTQ